MPKDKKYEKGEHSRRYIYECDDSDEEAYSRRAKHDTLYTEHGNASDRRCYNDKTQIKSSNHRRGCVDDSLRVLDSSPYRVSKSNHKSSRDHEKQKDSWRKEDKSRHSSDVETPWKQKSKPLVDYEDGSSDSDLLYPRCSESRSKKKLWKNRDVCGEADHRQGRNHFTEEVTSSPISTKQSRYQMEYHDRHRDINGDWRHEKKKKKRHSKERNEEK